MKDTAPLEERPLLIPIPLALPSSNSLTSNFQLSDLEPCASICRYKK